MGAIMRSVKSNIQEFNAEVEKVVDALNARNAPIPELRTKLFTAYKSCGDTLFTMYFGRKEEEYEDGSNDLTSTQLMQLALEKFKVLTDKGEWMVKSEQELEFIALKAWKLEQTGKKPQANRPARVESDPAKKKADKFAWKLVAPKAGEPDFKTVNGKKYIYCPHHQITKWVLEVNQHGVTHRTGCRARNSGAPEVTALTSVMVEPPEAGNGFGGAAGADHEENL